jgi:N-acetyltransferase
MNWIDPNLVLEGEKVTLRPMQPEHIDGLVAAGADKKIWEFLPVNAEPADIRNHFFLPAFENRDNGTQFPFTIFDKNENIIGTTRFGEIEPEHRKLEIGWTWYKPEIWGKGYNEECKYLLLSYCFETLKTVRVQLKTNEKNYRSRRAILRLGCQFEGVYRNHVIRQGHIRNSAMFSMLPEEWAIAKPNLKDIIDNKYAGTYTYEPDVATVLYGDYTIITNKALMQPERIHRWLSTKSYWATGIPLDVVKTSFDKSFCIAVMHNGIQVGYARFITDYVIFAYLADVYIEEEHRGKG